MQLVKGQKLSLNSLGFDNHLTLTVSHTSNKICDVSVFGLNSQQQLISDDYMTFYNQPVTPCGSVQLINHHNAQTTFVLNLSTLPNRIHTLMLTAVIDGEGDIKDLTNLHATITTNGKTLTFYPKELGDEKALMLLQIYQKDGWRIGAVGQGFSGGLQRLVEHFGATVADDISINPTPLKTTTPLKTSLSSLDLKKKLSLEKASKTNNQSIIDLTKKSLITLEKKNLLNVQAKVALVLDASGSMAWQYNNGDVQKVVNRLMPLAINFDDDGSFECWAFAQHTTRLDEVTLQNVNDFVKTTKGGHHLWQVGSRINEEIPAIQAVIDYYKKEVLPVYVLFISDGGVGSSRQMQNILTKASNLPIFWQFVGIGGYNYGVLEKLDTMQGRTVDNCNFFALDRIDSMPDEQLYEMLLTEFPIWLTQIKNIFNNQSYQSPLNQNTRQGLGGLLSRLFNR